MKHDPARSTSALCERASAHRAMAIAALHSDTSLSNRLRRYNEHMTKARALEADAERQQITATHDEGAAPALIKPAKTLRIDSLNLRDHLCHVRVLETQGGAR